MLIESAFFKLPELLTSREDEDRRNLNEATILHSFATSVYMEFSARSVERAYEKVVTEKPYDVQSPSPHQRKVDLYVEGGRRAPGEGYEALYHYGHRERHWIEMKTFLRTGRQGETATTMNAGKVLSDLVRVCLLPGGEGRVKDGRYLLLISDREPDEIFAFQREGREERRWLRSFFEPGSSSIDVNFEQEPPTLMAEIGDQFEGLSGTLSACFFTRRFSPQKLPVDRSLFWGYLVNVEGFSIELEDLKVDFDAYGQESWQKSDAKNFRQVAKRVVQLMAPENAE